MRVITAMRIASKVLVFFCFPFNALGYQVHFVPDIDIFNDLVALNITCFPDDSCQNAREEDYPGVGQSDRCSCHAQCAVYDTCCFDSPHRGYGHPLMECQKVDVPGHFSNKYFLVGKCPFDVRGDSVWKSLCEDPWNEEDDILKIAPVTSLDTSTVYKNIYCFRCHERSDNFHPWYLHMEGSTPNKETPDSKNFAASYNKDKRTWEAISHDDDESVSIRVDLYFTPTPEKYTYDNMPYYCRTDIISDCKDSWTDDHIRDKCRGYYARRYAYYEEYKNPHCAICNYVRPEDITCTKMFFTGQSHVSGGSSGGGKWFSFRRLLGGMYSDGDNKAEKLQNKCSENHLWDPYGKRCRKITCALPGYVVRNGRCIRP